MGKQLKNEKPIIFQIDAGTYDYAINVIITDDFDYTAEFVNHKFEYKDRKITQANFDMRKGICFFRDGYCPIIWLPRIPDKAVDLATLSHEIFHAVCHCMSWAGMYLNDSSEEAYCHLIGHITRKFWNKIFKLNSKK